MQLAAIVVGVDRYAAFKMAVLRFIVLVELERPASRFQMPPCGGVQYQGAGCIQLLRRTIVAKLDRRLTGACISMAVSGCACNQTAKIGVSIEFRMLGRDRHRIYPTMRVPLRRAPWRKIAK